jgi:hypothetical protein
MAKQMITKKSKRPRKLRIDLTGSDGNAFVLLGIAKGLCAKTGIEWSKVQKEMTSGNYENLIQTLEKYFSSIIIMER